MKAAIYRKFGASNVLEVTEVANPEPGLGEMLIKVEAAALNPKDVLLRKGKMKAMNARGWPKPVGHDVAGTVSNVGPGVDGFNPGDRVFGMVNGRRLSTCAEHCLLRQDEAATMPETISFAEAAAIPLAAQTAAQALRDNAGLKPGQSVLINGASGGVGTFAVQIAKAMGAEVTAVSSEANRELLLSLGADHWIDYKTTDILKPSQPYDVFFDVFGNKSFATAKPALKKNGCYITTVPSPAAVVKHLLGSVLPGKSGKLVVVKSKTADLQFLRSLYEQQLLKPVIDSKWPLTDIAKAQEKIETKRARGKVIVLP